MIRNHHFPQFPQHRQAGGSALGASRGAHPTVRLDSFLKSTDPSYQHAEAGAGQGLRCGARFLGSRVVGSLPPKQG